MIPVLQEERPVAGVDGWADILRLDDRIFGLDESAAHRCSNSELTGPVSGGA